MDLSLDLDLMKNERFGNLMILRGFGSLRDFSRVILLSSSSPMPHTRLVLLRGSVNIGGMNEF